MAGVLELNNDQRRELVNTRQRYQAWQNAVAREHGYRGSMVWTTIDDVDYLVRSAYDENNVRRQKSLGRRNLATETVKGTFDRERQDAVESRKALDETLQRQAAVNRALGLGRVPLTAARILRAFDRRGLLGAGLRVAGTNALYAYEAACGVMVDADITATTDIDFLFDARRRLFLIATENLASRSLLDVLKSADRSFSKTRQSFRAQNGEGYLVDLIKPMRDPPWSVERSSIGDADDLQAAEIEGLTWLENAPAFEQIAIDERGQPLRIVVPDPRIFAIHKLWMSNQPGRDPAKRRRDAAQAHAVADLTMRYLIHLPFELNELRMIPLDVTKHAMLAFGITSGQV